MSHFFRYSGFGLSISSAIELPEFERRDAGDLGPDVVVQTGTVPRIRRTVTLNEQLAINEVGAAFLIREGREITVDAGPDADPGSVRAVLLGKVMAFLLRQRGWLPLHASGVVIEGRCVLFLGASGGGKSTTAAAFYRAGYPVLTDDVGAVRVGADGTCVAQAAWPHVRLMEEAREILADQNLDSRIQIDKYKFDLSQSKLPDRCPLACICVLEHGPSPSLTRLPASRAVTELSKNSFIRHRNMERMALDAHLRDCTNVATRVPVHRLERPLSLETLPQVVQLVEVALRSGASNIEAY